MQVVKLDVEAATAKELYDAYKQHRHYSTPIDDEIRSAYRAISKGKLVIRALESIRLAGVDEKGLPKLAIATAQSATCRLTRWRDGSARFEFGPDRWSGGRFKKYRESYGIGSFSFPENSFPMWRDSATRASISEHEAQVPLIPIHLRPKQALDQYHILFEAEWSPIPPKDPFLLRRIGQADLWVVTAMWDLTEVERAALATRVTVS